MSQKHHVPSASQGRKVLPAHARPSRPPMLKRGSSYNNAHSRAQGGSSGRPGSGPSKKAGPEVAKQQDEEEDEMASFLQFCPTCEKMIVTPGSSILYCSEACRKKDVSQPTPLQTTHSPPLSPLAPSYSDTHLADIVPQRSPTILRPVSLTFSDLSISEVDSPIDLSAARFGRHDSEAVQYLASFRSGSLNEDTTVTRRPYMNRASTVLDTSGLPSLIHSPSSSVGTVASVASSRPLPSRHNKSYSSYSSKPIDLMAPCDTTAPSSPTQATKDASFKSCASTLTAFRVAEAGDFSYDKRRASRRDSEAQGSLRQLFSHDAMLKAPPTQANQVAKTD